VRAHLNRWLMGRSAKPLAFFAALLPLCWLILATAMNWLGANPAELCLALAVTPVRKALSLPALARFRRMIGLFVYFYAMVHFAAYAWFDMGFDPAAIAKDIVKRPFVLVGFAAVVLLTPLALTSFNRAMRVLGGRRWQMLHRLVYAVAGLAVLHFFWMRAGKNNFAEVFVYGAVLGTLLGWRVVQKIRGSL
jgi:sulfoxide reductase heme-binding subunit YedZ